MKISTILLVCALCCAGLRAQESSLTPLADYEEVRKEQELVQQAQEYAEAHKYAKAAKWYRRAAMMQTAPEKRAEYLMLEAENLLLGRKSHKAKAAYFELMDNYRFLVPFYRVLEQMRELADLLEHGTGTLLHIPDPGASIEIYRKIVECQPSGEQSLNDRLVLGKKLEKDGQPEEAVKLYQETIKLIPRNPDVRLALAQCLSGLAVKSDGDGELSRAAIREAKTFLELSTPMDPRRDQVNEILLRAQNDEANRLLERAEFYLAKYHYRPEVARRYLLDIQRDYPESAAIPRVQELLKKHFPADVKE